MSDVELSAWGKAYERKSGPLGREPTVEELKAALWKLIEHDDAEYYKVYDTYKTGGWRAVVLFLTGEEWDG